MAVMITQKPLEKFGLESRSEDKKFSKFLKIYFFIIHALTCLDFGFNENMHRLAKIFISTLNILLRLALGAMSILTAWRMPNGLGLGWGPVTLLAENMLVIVTYIASRSLFKVANLFADLMTIDELFGTICVYKVEGKMVIFTVTMMALRVFIYIIGRTVREAYFLFLDILEILYNFEIFCTYFFLTVYFFVLFSIYCRLKKLKEVMKNDFEIRRANLIYMAIIDCTEKIKQTLDVPFLVVLVFTVLVVMVDVFITLEMIISNKYTVAVYVVRYMEISFGFLILFAPVLLADMMAIQVDNIKVILHDKICHNNGADMKNYAELSEFIGYVEARGCKLRACRVVPLDLTLPVTVFNVCVTYLIVMIQFADLY